MSRKYEKDLPPVKSRSYIAKRKRIRKKAERMFPGSRFKWVGGILYSIEWDGTLLPMERFEHVPAPGKEVLGLMANKEPEFNAREHSYHYRASQSQSRSRAGSSDSSQGWRWW